MKKVIIAFGAVCMLAFTSCKQDATQKIDEKNVAEAANRDAAATKFPIVEFENAEHDFGEIINGTPVETVFKYKNIGDAPLVITNIKSTCGCTVPQDWDKKPLAPGGEGQFTVKFNGRGANKIGKTITLITNSKIGNEKVKISAFIKPDPNKATPAVPLVQ